MRELLSYLKQHVNVQQGKNTLIIIGDLDFNLYCFLPVIENQRAVHVSALLHALVGISPASLSPNEEVGEDEEEESVPVTSQLCQWTVPRKVR